MRPILRLVVAVGCLMAASIASADHWHGSGFRGYTQYRPYFNNWSGGNVQLNIGGVGRGYSSFSYYQGPIYGGYYYPQPYYYNYGYSPYALSSNYYYGTYYSPRYNSVDYFLDPTFQPAELAFGPQAMKQFMGVDRNFGLAPLRNDPAPLPRVEQAKPVVREVDWDARRKADTKIAEGDELFRQQKFYDALLRYRLAIQADPNYSEAHLRHGFSLISRRRYDEAAAALAKAFALDPQIIKSGFRLDQLYGENRLTRDTHQEALAQAALDEPNNSAPHFDLGMWLLFSGEAERSRKFFEKARELGMAPGDDVPVVQAGREL